MVPLFVCAFGMLTTIDYQYSISIFKQNNATLCNSEFRLPRSLIYSSLILNWIRKYSRFSSKSAALAINSDMAGFVYFWFESKAVESVFLCIWLILRGRKTERAKKRECKINFCSLISQANRGIFSCIRKFAEDRGVLAHCVRDMFLLKEKGWPKVA